jgi:hypothetical protein
MEANPQISTALAEIVLRALAKKPEARFQSADAFLQALPKVPAEPAVGTARNSLRRPVLIAACVVLMILVGALVAAMTTRIGNAQSDTGKSLVAPASAPAMAAAPAPMAAPPPETAPTAEPAAPRKAVLKTPHHRPAQTNNVTTEDAPSQTKSRNPVAKLGSALKRINPFQQSSPTPQKDDPKN